LAGLDGGVPRTWTVIVAAARGLYAKWLFTTIQHRGWHPYLRINRQGQYRPAGAAHFRPLRQVVTRVGQRWSGPVTWFATKDRQLACSLLARWDRGYTDPWLVLTDLAPQQAAGAWYGLRAWIACGFKDAKRGGWHGEQTKMRDPQRAERLWLARAVATLGVVRVGCQAEVGQGVPVLGRVVRSQLAGRRCHANQSPVQRVPPPGSWRARRLRDGGNRPAAQRAGARAGACLSRSS